MPASLAGLRILIMRPEGQGGDAARRLESLGASVVEKALTRMEGLGSGGYPVLDEALARLATYRWIVFTSAGGVRCFLERAGERAGKAVDLNALLPPGLRVAAVGLKTAEACFSAGRKADIIPGVFRGEGLARSLLEAGAGPGDPVLLVRALEGSDVLPDSLREAGVPVTVAPAYRTAGIPEAAAAVARRLQHGEFDLVVATSGGALRELASAVSCMPEAKDRIRVAALGPVTAAVARELGFTVGLVSPKATMESLIDSVEKQFGKSGPKGRTRDR
jgi:uroporphyrinogen III methyltransferase/synthase